MTIARNTAVRASQSAGETGCNAAGAGWAILELGIV